jgi:hypothetical protein
MVEALQAVVPLSEQFYVCRTKDACWLGNCECGVGDHSLREKVVVLCLTLYEPREGKLFHELTGALDRSDPA